MSGYFLQALKEKFPLKLLSRLGPDKKKIRKQSSKLSCVDELILSKFEGTLLGSLIGDCVGKTVESLWGPNLNELLDEFREIKEHFINSDSISENQQYVFDEQIKQYTDDTALSMALCDSLISKTEFDIVDIADRFQATYLNNPSRGYSTCAIALFKRLALFKRNKELKEKCLTPAMEIFNGEGSYGNGGGMRCSPIALFTYTKSLEEMKLACELSTRLTHTHIWSVLGALQQCYAIRLALNCHKPPHLFDFDDYFQKIISFVHDMENKFETHDLLVKEKLDSYSECLQDSFSIYLDQKSQISKNGTCPSPWDKHANNISNKKSRKVTEGSKNYKYSNLLKKLYKLAQKCKRGERINVQRLHKHVATCGISALESIPIALFSFIVASDPKCFNEVNHKLNSANAFKEYSPIERVIFYAISFGGETHKIASMAGALAGAFFSRRELPDYLFEICESHNEITSLARQLFHVSVHTELELLNSSLLGGKSNMESNGGDSGSDHNHGGTGYFSCGSSSGETKASSSVSSV